MILRKYGGLPVIVIYLKDSYSDLADAVEALPKF